MRISDWSSDVCSSDLWSSNPANDALWLTASICYDATDLKLASDLRDRSDVFAIPALNLDVGTFDQMAQALHYHMFQLVLIANNGAYGAAMLTCPRGRRINARSEEHTSELQSLMRISYA